MISKIREASKSIEAIDHDRKAIIEKALKEREKYENTENNKSSSPDEMTDEEWETSFKELVQRMIRSRH
jgi:hypothetical protein